MLPLSFPLVHHITHFQSDCSEAQLLSHSLLKIHPWLPSSTEESPNLLAWLWSDPCLLLSFPHISHAPVEQNTPLCMFTVFCFIIWRNSSSPFYLPLLFRSPATFSGYFKDHFSQEAKYGFSLFFILTSCIIFALHSIYVYLHISCYILASQGKDWQWYVSVWIS
jgi:hypothetical protein